MYPYHVSIIPGVVNFFITITIYYAAPTSVFHKNNYTIELHCGKLNPWGKIRKPLTTTRIYKTQYQLKKQSPYREMCFRIQVPRIISSPMITQRNSNIKFTDKKTNKITKSNN